MGKKSKIALRVLQNSKREGGLNLVDLKRRDNALKSTWPLILRSEKEYADMIYPIMKCKALKEDIWRCNLKAEHVKTLKIRNNFWEDVLKSWCKFNYYYKRRIDNQIIWYNSEIMIGGKPVMWNDVYKRGLKYVCQLFSPHGYKTDQQVQDEYGLSKMRFNSLKAAIKQETRSFFQENSVGTYMPMAPHQYDLAISVYKRKLSGIVYDYLGDDILLAHNKYISWRLEMGETLTEGICEFAKEISQVYRLTNIPKFRSFQYRLMHRALITNIQLRKMGKN